MKKSCPLAGTEIWWARPRPRKDPKLHAAVEPTLTSKSATLGWGTRPPARIETRPQRCRLRGGPLLEKREKGGTPRQWLRDRDLLRIVAGTYHNGRAGSDRGDGLRNRGVGLQVGQAGTNLHAFRYGRRDEQRERSRNEESAKGRGS